MSKSEIAVLIPHYNNPKGLSESLDSINETIKVDIFVVDDGSKLKPHKQNLIQNYTHGDIYFIDLEINQGIEHALNKGLREIQNQNYPFIGRLDCGDTCIENKFYKQISFLKKNENTFLLGSWVNIVDKENNYLYTLKHPTSYQEIKNKMYLNSMFVHPTVVFRLEIINDLGYYPVKYEAAEDYAFFFKVIKKYKSENLPEPLLNYVIDENSISSTKRKIQVKSRIKIIIDNFYFGAYPIYGLIRNILLLFLSRNTTTFIKRKIQKN